MRDVSHWTPSTCPPAGGPSHHGASSGLRTAVTLVNMNRGGTPPLRSLCGPQGAQATLPAFAGGKEGASVSSRGSPGLAAPRAPPLSALCLLTPESLRRRMWGAGTGGQEGYLERSWLEPRLSMGEMLPECRCVACLLGDTDRDPALGLVRDRERLFFFFSCGLLEEKRV